MKKCKKCKKFHKDKGSICRKCACKILKMMMFPPILWSEMGFLEEGKV